MKMFLIIHYNVNVLNYILSVPYFYNYNRTIRLKEDEGWGVIWSLISYVYACVCVRERERQQEI